MDQYFLRWLVILGLGRKFLQKYWNISGDWRIHHLFSVDVMSRREYTMMTRAISSFFNSSPSLTLFRSKDLCLPIRPEDKKSEGLGPWTTGSSLRSLIPTNRSSEGVKIVGELFKVHPRISRIEVWYRGNGQGSHKKEILHETLAILSTLKATKQLSTVVIPDFLFKWNKWFVNSQTKNGKEISKNPPFTHTFSKASKIMHLSQVWYLLNSLSIPQPHLFAIILVRSLHFHKNKGPNPCSLDFPMIRGERSIFWTNFPFVCILQFVWG